VLTQYVHELEIYNSKPSDAGPNFYNELCTYIKQETIGSSEGNVKKKKEFSYKGATVQ
jgi:hypothetical protein